MAASNLGHSVNRIGHLYKRFWRQADVNEFRFFVQLLKDKRTDKKFKSSR
jgi:hypothetical protein